MTAQLALNEQNFNEMEQHILNQVMAMSKSMLESFKFRMIYGLKVSPKQKKQTLAHLKEFREKNWDKAVNRKEAYEKYVNLY